MRKNNFIIICLFSLFLIGFAFRIDHRRDVIKNEVMITEICAKNDFSSHTINGDYLDYIEFYNASDHPVNLKGYGLSDSKKNVYQYKFPDCVIQPESFLIVYTTAQDEVRKKNLENEFVADFNIKENDTIIFTTPHFETIEYIVVPSMMEDQSYVRKSVDENTWFIENASPNMFHAYDDATIVHDPEMSVHSGFYSSQFEVSISSDANTEIYYTLDGSEPDESSNHYYEPIMIQENENPSIIYSEIRDITRNDFILPTDTIDKCTVLKAIAIRDGQKSNVVSESYFVGYQTKEEYEGYPVISMVVDPDDLFSQEKGIYVRGEKSDSYFENTGEYNVDLFNYMQKGKETEREAKIFYFDKNHDLELSQNIGIRLHGNSTRENAQKSFNLYARTRYDEFNYLNYPFFGNYYHVLTLRNDDPIKVRDAMNQKLIENLDVTTEKQEPCVLFLNGEYWGLYTLIEKVDAEFLSFQYDIPEEDILVLKTGKTIEDGNKEHQNDFIQLLDYCQTHDLSEQNNYRYVASEIDIQSYIDFWLAEVFIANADCFNNNFAVWKNDGKPRKGAGDGKWRWIVYDTDVSTNLMQITSVDTNSLYENLYSDWGYAAVDDILFQTLIKNDKFKEQLLHSYENMKATSFSKDNINKTTNEIARKYEKQAVLSYQRWLGYFTQDMFQTNINRIIDFYENRAGYLDQYMTDFMNTLQ